MPRPSSGPIRAGHPAVRYAVPAAAAAAVALGLSLGTDCTMAVAAADSAGAGADSASAQGPAAPRGREAAGRSRVPRAAAAVSGRADRRAGPVVRPRIATPPLAATSGTDIRPPAAAVDGPDPDVRPAPMVAARTALGSATSPALGANGLLSQFKTFFGGGSLLVRRSLFNKPPTVNPVQLTGQSGGPITGTIGAVDPDGDALTYKITASPSFGTATVGQDGRYTYTPGTDFAGNDTFAVVASDTGFHINLLGVRRPSGTTASVSVTQGKAAPQLRFQFVYRSGSQLWSPEARGALEAAAARLASYFVVTSPVTVTYEVTGQYAPLSLTLASAGSDFADPQAAGFLKTVVQKKIQTGVDANGPAADGTITWNFGQSWAFADPAVGNQFDFQATAMHELLHTFGFLSNTVQPGANRDTAWTVFDSYIVNSAGAKVITGDFKWNTAYNPNLTGDNGGLYFSGPNAVAVNRGKVSLYTPRQWVPGSSVSHLNDFAFYGPNDQMMNAKSMTGQGIRKLSAVELAILRDIGYQVTGGSPALAFLGLVFTRRARRRD